jgi:hypothetical protein
MLRLAAWIAAACCMLVVGAAQAQAFATQRFADALMTDGTLDTRFPTDAQWRVVPPPGLVSPALRRGRGARAR